MTFALLLFMQCFLFPWCAFGIVMYCLFLSLLCIMYSAFLSIGSRFLFSEDYVLSGEMAVKMLIIVVIKIKKSN